MIQWDSNNNQALRRYVDTLFQVSFEGTLKGIVFDISALDSAQIDDFFMDQEDVKYYSHNFHENEIVDPYYPFLNSIRDYFSRLSIQDTLEIFEKLDIYSLHQPLLTELIYHGTVTRKTPLLRVEVYFEEVVMVQGIIKLLKYVATTADIVFFLGDIQRAKNSTLMILEKLVTEEDMNILFIGTINLDLISEYDEGTKFDKFIEHIDEKEWIITLNQSFVSEQTYLEIPYLEEKERIDNISRCIELLAIADAIEYGRQLYIEFSNQATIYKEKEYFKVLKLLGRSYYLLKDKESALFYDNMALGIAREEKNNQEVCKLSIRLGYDYSIRREVQIARKYADSACELARSLKDTSLEYDGMFLKFIIDTEVVAGYVEHDENWYEDLIKETIHLGHENYLSMIYTNPYQLHDNFTELKEQRFDQGIKLTKKIGNNHQLSVAYHNRGIVYSRNGQIKETFEYYKKSQEIKEQIGDSRRLAYIYNSLGYYYFITEQYELSHREYVKSFNASSKSRDYDEIGMTLYNIGMNAFLYGKYDKACEYITMLLKLMKICSIESLRYHSRRNIYDIYVIALIKNGNESKARDIYNKLKIWGITTIEEKAEESFMELMSDFFYHYNDSEAERYLMNAEALVSAQETPLLHFRKFFMIEKVLYYKYKGDNYYKKVLRVAKKEFQVKDSYETIRKLDYISKSNNDSIETKTSVELEDVSSDFNQIIFTARIDQNLHKLRNRLNEINFLNIVQNMLMNEKSLENLLIRFQQLIHGNTMVEKSFCRVVKKQGYKTMNIEDSRLLINEIYADRIFAYIGDKTKPHLTYSGNTNLLVLKKVYGYSSIMYLPIYVDHERKIEFIFMTQRSDGKLSQDDLGIMTLIGRQIGEAIERINKNKALEQMNQKLKVLSRTDLLTGLNNRNALENHLQKEQMNINNGGKNNLILLFIDLDNFKYYNDTFGHSIGDELLIQFGKILKKVTNNKDFVARFGGDEFVAILNRKAEEQGHKIAHDIYKIIKEYNYFEGTISRLLDTKVQIPKDKRLSCSIGLSSLDDLEVKDMDQLLKNSDLALYKAKSLGKAQVQKLT